MKVKCDYVEINSKYYIVWKDGTLQDITTLPVGISFEHYTVKKFEPCKEKENGKTITSNKT